MTAQQPEALRLADLLTDSHLPVHHKAAAELRRLQAENDDFRATIDHLTRENAEQIGEIVALKEQRDELLEALKEATDLLQVWIECCPPYDEALDDRKVLKKSRAAIAKAEGETK